MIFNLKEVNRAMDKIKNEMISELYDSLVNQNRDNKLTKFNSKN